MCPAVVHAVCGRCVLAAHRGKPEESSQISRSRSNIVPRSAKGLSAVRVIGERNRRTKGAGHPEASPISLSRGSLRGRSRQGRFSRKRKNFSKLRDIGKPDWRIRRRWTDERSGKGQGRAVPNAKLSDRAGSRAARPISACLMVDEIRDQAERPHRVLAAGWAMKAWGWPSNLWKEIEPPALV